MDVKNGKVNAEGLFAAPIHEESYDVMEHEILVQIDKSAAYRDAQTHCFSFGKFYYNLYFIWLNFF